MACYSGLKLKVIISFLILCSVTFITTQSDDVNECNALTCHGNGVCTNSPGSYSCRCFHGYDVDSDCETEVVDSDDQSSAGDDVTLSDASVALISTAGILLVVTVLVIVTFTLCDARTWKKRVEQKRAQVRVQSAETAVHGDVDKLDTLSERGTIQLESSLSQAQCCSCQAERGSCQAERGASKAERGASKTECGASLVTAIKRAVVGQVHLNVHQ